MEKQFAIPASQIRLLASGHGACYASDQITVGGARVGFMYRERADFETDSGWRFFSGSEDEEYTLDPGHFAIYDVNTIANYDAEIIPLLDAPVGAAFIRDPVSQTLVADDFTPPSD